ncbi:hypothetical protein C8R44DRAFT_858766 [Mycena epipterygia]|nr:hypothetical protein C8R44DRAFT_858766 [Mycena epipterygia]
MADSDIVPNREATATAPLNQNVASHEKDADKAKRRGDQPERPAKICGCACRIDCNCKCTCSHRDHCVCAREPCEGKCGDRVSRNLVISIDGTSNQFGLHNTNVVKLHSRVLSGESAKQTKYYNCGIGTYVPYRIKSSLKYWGQQTDNALDLAFALNFKDIILKAYKWLCQTYKPGDKIFFFGFSRGAYQVRTLAGMIETVGLIDPGNEELIPLDTVSSVGVFRGKPLPLTLSAQHICIFRHALALDERRVKFLPEYVNGGASLSEAKVITGSSQGPTNVKEVWFAGTHSDIGGGVEKDLDLNLSSVPLLWMENEATSAGLRLDPRLEGGVWDIEDLREDPVHESLTGPWRALEHLPLTRLSFNTAQDVTSTPHRGAGRIIVPGQHIHISVAFKKDYIPRATFLEDTDIAWESFVGKNIETSTFEWAHQLGEKVEMDLFNGSLMIEAVTKLQELGDTFESKNEPTASSSANLAPSMRMSPHCWNTRPV